MTNGPALKCVIRGEGDYVVVALADPEEKIFSKFRNCRALRKAR